MGRIALSVMFVVLCVSLAAGQSGAGDDTGGEATVTDLGTIDGDTVELNVPGDMSVYFTAYVADAENVSENEISGWRRVPVDGELLAPREIWGIDIGGDRILFQDSADLNMSAFEEGEYYVFLWGCETRSPGRIQVPGECRWLTPRTVELTDEQPLPGPGDVCRVTAYDRTRQSGGRLVTTYATDVDLSQWDIRSARVTGDECTARLWTRPNFAGESIELQRDKAKLANARPEGGYDVESVEITGGDRCRVTLYEHVDFNQDMNNYARPPDGNEMVIVDDSSRINMGGDISSVEVQGADSCEGHLYQEPEFEGDQLLVTDAKPELGASGRDSGWDGATRSIKTDGNAIPEKYKNIWGVMYFPADAYNAWQMWADYDREEIERDMGYAASLNMNAVRLFASYEYWREHPQKFENRFNHFLSTASANGIQVLPMLFESIGDAPTPENLRDTDIKTSFAIHSPSRSKYIGHAGGQPKWAQGERSPQDFVRWFAGTYGDDDRLLAIEIMNEPGKTEPRHSFVTDMLRTAREASPDAVLTMGSKELFFNLQYEDPELDIYQFHKNVPLNGAMQPELERAERFAQRYGKPVWLTEWQRYRDIAVPEADYPNQYADDGGGTSIIGKMGYKDRMLPNYESLAPTLRNWMSEDDTNTGVTARAAAEPPADTIHGNGMSGFFMWGLMLKPAYICKPRVQGRINGLFLDEDVPTVWDLEDARAIAGDPEFQAREEQRLPEGMTWFQDKDPGAYCSG